MSECILLFDAVVPVLCDCCPDGFWSFIYSDDFLSHALWCRLHKLNCTSAKCSRMTLLCVVGVFFYTTEALFPSCSCFQIISGDWVCERRRLDVSYATPKEAPWRTCKVNIHILPHHKVSVQSMKKRNLWQDLYSHQRCCMCSFFSFGLPQTLKLYSDHVEIRQQGPQEYTNMISGWIYDWILVKWTLHSQLATQNIKQLCNWKWTGPFPDGIIFISHEGIVSSTRCINCSCCPSFTTKSVS